MSAARSGRFMLSCALLTFALAGANLPQASQAQDMPRQQAGESKAKTAIREVLADPVFGGQQEETEWSYINSLPDDTPDEKQKASPSWITGLLNFIESLSKVLRIVIWIGGALLLAGLIYLSYRYRNAWLGPAGKRAAPPNFLFGLDVRPESLPEDIVSTALKELENGNAKKALGLLYRAALVSLIHHSQLVFHAGHTEDDCLRLVRTAVDSGCSGYFAELMDAWKLTAYAHAAPPRDVLEALCHRWRAHFALAGNAA